MALAQALNQWCPAHPLPSFVEFCEMTTGLTLEPWQKVYAQRLGEWVHKKGQKLLLHAPPQLGKSLFAAGRLPAYLIGSDPLNRRVRLITTTERSAFRYGNATKSTLIEFAGMLPPSAQVEKESAATEFFTQARKDAADGHPSFRASSIGATIVGTGATDWIVDDPYSSPEAAYSDLQRESIQTWLDDALLMRTGPDDNIVVFFHRWHCDDIAGLLIDRGWEYLRFPAICDSEDDLAGRKIGEALSPRWPIEHLRSLEKANPDAFMALYQGTPIAAGGGMIKRAWFKVQDIKDVKLQVRCAGVGTDLAVTEKTSADYTVALPGILATDNQIYIGKPFHKRVEWPEGRREIIAVAKRIRAHFVACEIAGQQRGLVDNLIENAPSINVLKVPAGRGDKESKARMWTPVAEAGRITLLEDGSGWTREFLKQMEQFPKGKHDDLVDSVSQLLEGFRRNYGNVTVTTGREDIFDKDAVLRRFGIIR
jgi:predicted phage terminase large subunit-like protein